MQFTSPRLELSCRNDTTIQYSAITLTVPRKTEGNQIVLDDYIFTAKRLKLRHTVYGSLWHGYQLKAVIHGSLAEIQIT